MNSQIVQYFYSPSENSFFLSNFHKEMPEDVFETDEPTYNRCVGKPTRFNVETNEIEALDNIIEATDEELINSLFARRDKDIKEINVLMEQYDKEKSYPKDKEQYKISTLSEDEYWLLALDKKVLMNIEKLEGFPDIIYPSLNYTFIVKK